MDSAQFKKAWRDHRESMGLFLSEMERIDHKNMALMTGHGFRKREEKDQYFGAFSIGPGALLFLKLSIKEDYPRKSIKVKGLSHLSNGRLVEAIINSLVYCLK